MPDTIIYALSDPRTRSVRYVGKTVDLPSRVAHHKCDFRQRTYKCNWVKALRAEGLTPECMGLEIIPGIDGNGWQDAERFWICYLRFLGCDLTNLDSGGEGGPLKNEASREKIRRANLGKTLSTEIRAKISAALRGRPKSQELRRKIGLAHKGRTQSPEAIANSVAAKRRNFTPEVRSRMALSQLGKKASLEARRNMSEAAKRRRKPGAMLQ